MGLVLGPHRKSYVGQKANLIMRETLTILHSQGLFLQT